jgi:hypothetical protein
MQSKPSHSTFGPRQNPGRLWPGILGFYSPPRLSSGWRLRIVSQIPSQIKPANQASRGTSRAQYQGQERRRRTSACWCGIDRDAVDPLTCHVKPQSWRASNRQSPWRHLMRFDRLPPDYSAGGQLQCNRYSWQGSQIARDV